MVCYLCEVSDMFIKTKSKSKHFKLNRYKNLDKHKHTKLNFDNPNIDDLEKKYFTPT